MANPEVPHVKAAVLQPLSADELARRRRRSVAIATVLIVLAVLFYVVTLVKTGGPVNMGKP
jgi:hypothetical protein